MSISDLLPMRRRQVLALPLALSAGWSTGLAQAKCAVWKVTGPPVSLRQSDKAVVQLMLGRNGNRIFGKADYFRSYVGKILGILSKGVDVNMVGQVEGMLDGPRLEFKISWNNDSLGIYKLKIDTVGGISGISYDFHNPSNRVGVVGDGPLGCLQQG